jgi:hypothetical protein
MPKTFKFGNKDNKFLLIGLVVVIVGVYFYNKSSFGIFRGFFGEDNDVHTSFDFKPGWNNPVLTPIGGNWGFTFKITTRVGGRCSIMSKTIIPNFGSVYNIKVKINAISRYGQLTLFSGKNPFVTNELIGANEQTYLIPDQAITLDYNQIFLSNIGKPLEIQFMFSNSREYSFIMDTIRIKRVR